MPSLVTVLSSLVAFGAVLALVVGGGRLLREVSTRWWGRQLEQRQKALDDLFLGQQSAARTLWLSLAAAGGLGMLCGLMARSLVLGLLAAGATLAVPHWWFEHLRIKRRHRFEEQLPMVLDQLAASARAGLSLVQAMEEAVAQVSAPAAEEFGLIVQDYRLGSDLKRAIEAARLRLGSDAFNLAATAMIVYLQLGGDLPETLDRIAQSLKEIWRVEQKFITASVEGRKSIKVIALMPIALFLMVALAQPSLIHTLTGQLAGWVFLALASLLYVAALYWARRVMMSDL